jgi:hypothetical protein
MHHHTIERVRSVTVWARCDFSIDQMRVVLHSTYLAAIFSLALLAAGCAESTEAQPGYQDLTGLFVGSMDAWSSGGLSRITGTLSLSLAQDGAGFSDSYTVSGSRTFFTSPYPVPISFTGLVTDGRVGPGENPPFTFRFKVNDCTDSAYPSRGSFTSDGHGLSVDATIPEPAIEDCRYIETVSDTVHLVQ